MCGIFTLLNYSEVNYDKFIRCQFMKGKNRGPEFSDLQHISMNAIFGFHRLAINGLDDISNQPITIDNIHLICNGEIYNYRELYKLMDVTPKTNSDCEVIIHLYKRYGIKQTLKMLDGVFAFALCDNNHTHLESNIYIARDPYGIRPLYFLKNTKYPERVIGFASELKMLSDFCNQNPDELTISQFKPGTYSSFNLNSSALAYWTNIDNESYHEPGFSLNSMDMSWINHGIQTYLIQSVEKRYLTTERPIACLLSGGLDSSLITALINEIHKKNTNEPLETFSIGLYGSEDLRNAKIVSKYIGTKHTEIIVTEQEMFDIIPELIYTIESYDTTTVRASIGNYLLGKYISKNSNAKVIFNGDGSDELCGGYLYMNYCSDVIEFDKETRRLLEDIYNFDVLRSDKCISSNGLEPRTPFLDRSFVNFYLSIPPSIRCHAHNSQVEKFLLRNAFSIDNFKNSDGKQILPDEILWRRKEAFSDGVSGNSRSLYQILQDFIVPKYESNIKPIDAEKQYYKSLFSENYPNSLNIIPYYWMPKYTNTDDPSARTLTTYNK
jgi:asparagine synthase (glutamine-hydrolysing)